MCCFSRQCNARVCARLTTRGGVWGGGGSDVRHIRHAMSRFSKTALTLVETSVVLREGRVTASDLLQSAIARMTITRHLNAFIGGVLPGAAKAAETSDLRRRGKQHGASGIEPGWQEHKADGTTSTQTTHTHRSFSFLDGAPIAVKDNFFVPGAATTAGSLVLANFAPGNFTSTVSHRLANRGAVLFAKTNMDEFGMGSANANSAYGAVVNPFAGTTRGTHPRMGKQSRPQESTVPSSSETHSDESYAPPPRVSGGSSGGSAVAVASGAAVAAIGSDTGGSVRLPAAYCGLVGFKVRNFPTHHIKRRLIAHTRPAKGRLLRLEGRIPSDCYPDCLRYTNPGYTRYDRLTLSFIYRKPTYGRVSRWGLVPYCSSLDCPGFIGKTVTDVMLLTAATQGTCRKDPVTLPRCARIDQMVLDIEVADVPVVDDGKQATPEKHVSSKQKQTAPETKTRGFLKSKPGHPLAGWRVGIPSEYYLAELSDEVSAAWLATGLVCESLGAQLVTVSLPHTKSALAAYYVIAPSEAASNLARYDGVRFGDELDTGVVAEHEDASASLSKGMPREPLSPFNSGATRFRGQKFGKEVQRRVLVGTFVSSSSLAGRYVEKAQKVRRAVSNDFQNVFEKVDVLLTPTAPTVAPLLHKEQSEEFNSASVESNETNAGNVVAGYAADAMTVPASLAGLPALSLPVCFGTYCVSQIPPPRLPIQD
jgi:Asp-tRNA(Asn)/Glu-tRNA(Gln) amidotransferase A subunit family amidase